MIVGFVEFAVVEDVVAELVVEVVVEFFVGLVVAVKFVDVVVQQI